MATVISKNTLFPRTPPVAASVNLKIKSSILKSVNCKMNELAEVVEFIVGSQYIFFTPFYFTQFLFRKINKEKQSQH